MPAPESSIYFGNLRKAQWVKAPVGGLGASSVGTSEQMDYANGGAFVSQSAGAHREFDFSWPTGQESDFRFLREYREGDNGTGLMYWVDPMAMDVNALPPHVARPELSGMGWPSLLGAGQEPTLVPSGSIVRTNLALNPNVATNSTYYAVNAGSGGTAVGAASTGPSPIGSSFYRATWSVAPSTSPYLEYNAATAHDITAGSLYTLSAWVRSSVAGIITTSIVLFNGVAGTGTTQAAAAISANVWTRLSVTTSAPAAAGTNGAFCDFSLNQNIPAGGTLDMTGVLIERSPTLNPYFDGSTRFIGDRVAAWTGAANASTSTLFAPYTGMPERAATYTLSTPISTVAARKTVLLIPDTHTLYLGYSGSATGGGVVRVQTVTRDGAYGLIQDLVLLSPAAGVRLNASFDGATYSAVLIYMTQTITGTATLTLTSAKAVYSLTGITPVLTGSHVKGVGHSGMRFSSGPTFAYIYYNEDAGKKYVSAAAKFTEVGSWI